MITAIKSTLIRLSGKIYIFNPVKYFPLLMEGIACEFDRLREYKNIVMSSTVPNENMSPYSIDDYNVKFGIPATIPGTDAEKIARIIEKATLNGYPGADWLQDQIQKAGFPLYVIENEPLTTNIRQWGTFQWKPATQYGLTSRFINPDTVVGTLVVGSPPRGAGRAFMFRYGAFQWSTTATYGTYDPGALNPQPFVYVRTSDPRYWGYYFTLSPFPDRVAADESEFLSLPKAELEYLIMIIKQLKLQRNWCILQAKSNEMLRSRII
jgi:hypothetical protein